MHYDEIKLIIIALVYPMGPESGLSDSLIFKTVLFLNICQTIIVLWWLCKKECGIISWMFYYLIRPNLACVQVQLHLAREKTRRKEKFSINLLSNITLIYLYQINMLQLGLRWVKYISSRNLLGGRSKAASKRLWVKMSPPEQV